MQVLQIKEHSRFDNKTIEDIIKPLALDFSCNEGEIKYLKLNSNFETSYFIGIDWLIEKEIALMVAPKINNLDYLKMFMECFNHDEISKDISCIYKIYHNKKAIELKSNTFELTPLIIVHFLNTLINIVKRGLKKDYIKVEDNLQSKIKGKILFNRSLKINNFKGRNDRNFCNYQEYSINCIENQILKKALLFVSSYLKKHFKQDRTLFNSLNYCIGAFSDINEDIDITKIKQFKINPLYKEYSEALRLAKMIFKRFSYSINEINKIDNNKTPPFYIDMSLLFELYVFSKLRKEFGRNILYQSKGRFGNTDFLKTDEKIIIDTKYKPKYTNDYVIDDIRQLSGYSRDKGIMKKLQIEGDNTVVDCVIIYPNSNSAEDFTKRGLKESEINQFIKFFKCGIKLPLKQ
jgi:5-methylcytosine-specific restriction enzyme subunit McrC